MNYDVIINGGYQFGYREPISIEPDSVSYYEFIEGEYNSVENKEISYPQFSLSNYPNPFNPSTIISFNLTTEHTKNTEITICNSRGQKIKSLQISNPSSQNPNQITWDGTNETGKQIPSGVYLYKLVSNGKELATNKMLLLK